MKTLRPFIHRDRNGSGHIIHSGDSPGGFQNDKAVTTVQMNKVT